MSNAAFVERLKKLEALRDANYKAFKKRNEEAQKMLKIIREYRKKNNLEYVKASERRK
jgi:hypothetical protein